MSKKIPPPPLMISGRYLRCMLVMDDEDLGSLLRAAALYHMEGDLEDEDYPNDAAMALYCLIRDDLDEYHEELSRKNAPQQQRAAS